LNVFNIKSVLTIKSSVINNFIKILQMKYILKVLLLIVLFIPLKSLGQTSDFGIWTSIAAEKKVGKLNFSSNAELRTKSNSNQIDRYCFQVSASYNVLKHACIGLSYEYIYYHDIEYSDYQPRLRYIAFLQGKKSLGDFTFQLREQCQRTVKDESDRLKENGKFDNYAINPEWIWRNRFKVSYNIPHFPINPSLSIETFYQLNNSEGNAFSKIRPILSFSYNLAKHHEFEVYSLMDKEINVDNPLTRFVAGFGYTYSF
jgi:hypothetical protein